MDLAQLQREHKEWLARVVPDCKTNDCFAKLVEEVGELGQQWYWRLRSDDKYSEDELRDAIGDIVITLASFCNCHVIDFAECVQTAWDEVSQRGPKPSPVWKRTQSGRAWYALWKNHQLFATDDGVIHIWYCDAKILELSGFGDSYITAQKACEAALEGYLAHSAH